MALSLFKRVAILLVGVSVLGAARGAEVSQDPKPLTAKQIYQKYADSIVHIYIEDAKGDGYEGTGFFIDDGKQIATCFHVVRGAVKIFIEGSKKASWGVSWIGWDEKADLALLALKKDSGRTPCMASDLKEISPGDAVTVVGHPLGLETSITVGIVGAIEKESNRKVFQISAPISPGSSGSPVFDSIGEVIGIARSIATKGQNLNYASAITGLRNLPSKMTWEDFVADSIATAPSKEPDPQPAPADPPASPPVAAPPGSAEAEAHFMELFASWQAKLLIANLRWDLEWARDMESGRRSGLDSYMEDFTNTVRTGRVELSQAGTNLPTGRIDDLVPNLDALGRSAIELEYHRELMVSDMHRANPRTQRDIDDWYAADEKFHHMTVSVEEFYKDAPWFSWSKYKELLHNPICVQLVWGTETLDAYPDADITDMAYIGVPMPNSNFKTGDQIVGVSVSETEPFAPVKTWADYADFVSSHLANKRFFVRVVRKGLTFCFFSWPKPPR